jgi:small ubiquitin-related modifier
MEKVIRAFCEKVDIDMATVRLTFDGRRVEPTQTPTDLSLEDGDILDVLEQQIGGSF